MTKKAGEHHGQRVLALNKSKIYTQRGRRNDLGTPLQYSCLETPMDGGAWWAAVHGVAKSQSRLSDFTFTFHFHALEKENPRDGGAWWAAVYGVAQVGHEVT